MATALTMPYCLTLQTYRADAKFPLQGGREGSGRNVRGDARG
jgi:hypothetical protein